MVNNFYTANSATVKCEEGKDPQTKGMQISQWNKELGAITETGWGKSMKQEQNLKSSLTC